MSNSTGEKKNKKVSHLLFDTYPQSTLKKRYLENEYNLKTNVERVVGPYVGIKPWEVGLKVKTHPIVLARFMAYYILKNEYDLPCRVIGRIYEQDRKAVTNGIKRIEEWGLKSLVKKLFLEELSTYPQT